MSNKYEGLNREELIERIEELRKQLNNENYGLYFDRKFYPEDKMAQLKKGIPYLLKDNTRAIMNGSTNNIVIEGDNLHVLSALSLLDSTSSLADVIYIDPPYNTGAKDWKYNNDYVDAQDEFRHTKWLNMMEKRLNLAKSILKESGIIICAIDHYELFPLGMLMDQIFGEKNRLGIVSVVHKPEGRNQEKFFGTSNEFALFYSKEKEMCKFNNVAISEEVLKSFEYRDNSGLYRLNPFINKNHGQGGVDTSSRANRPTFWYPIYVSPDLSDISLINKNGYYEVYPVNSSGIERTWRTLPATLEERLDNNLIVAAMVGGKVQVYEKYYENEIIKTHWIDKKYNATFFGTKLLKEVLGENNFDFPKSLYLIKDILKITAPKNGLIVDFFAGSGTTGQAVLELNKEDGGNRKFILVTNNENNIMTDVCYPRLKTVITGIRPDGSKYSDGIPANLRYFKSEFIEDSPSKDQSKYNLVEKCNDMLCILEDTFDMVDNSDSYYVYENRPAEKCMSIFFDYFNKSQFDKMINKIKDNTSKEKVIYLFSLNNEIDSNEEQIIYENIPDAIIKPIPSKMYEIYKKIVDDLKRNY